MRRAVAALAVVLLVPPGVADAGADEALGVRGTVTGALERSSEVTIRTTATHPEGWQSLKSVRIELDLHDAVLESISYDLVNQTLRVGGGSVLAGTGNTASGSFFRVAGLGLRVTTAGTDMTLSFRATLLEEVPDDARFRFVAEDVSGAEASTALKAATSEEGGGLGLTTVILAVIAALVAGGFIGGQLTSRRPRSSVYSTVARTIERDRAERAGDRS